MELSVQSETAEPKSAVYRKIFNNNFSSDMESLKEFLQEDKDSISKINLGNLNRIKEDITITVILTLRLYSTVWSLWLIC